MASLKERLAALRGEQEGGSDATETGAPASAIDSSVSLIGTRDKSAIQSARLRARGMEPSAALNVEDMSSAIRTVESGGNYEAKGASGEYGAYQIMPGTWKQWAGSMEQTPENQDKIVKQKLGEWIKQGMTAEQIAAKWNSGSEKGWENKKGTNKFGVAYDVPAYVKKVTAALPNSDRPKGIHEEHILQQAHGVETKTPTVAPIGEQIGSMFERFGKAMAHGTGQGVKGMAVSREMVDNPDYMIDNNLDIAHMTPSEIAELRRKMEGKSDKDQRDVRIGEYTSKRDNFIKGANNFVNLMPEVPSQKTHGALGILDTAMTGIAEFAPTMAAGAATMGLMSAPMAYMQIMPGKLEEYEKAGLSREDAFKHAQATAIVLAAVEAGGTNIELSSLSKAFKKEGVSKTFGQFLKRYVDAAVNNGLTEGFEEWTQGELEMVFDTIAKNPDLTPEEIGKKSVTTLKDPNFQKEKLKDFGYGFVGGKVMGGAAVVGGEISQRIGQKVEKTGDGEFIVKPDDSEKKTDITDSTTKRGKPSVSQLFDAGDEARVKEDSDGGDGVTLSDNLNSTPAQKEQAKQTSNALSETLDNMKLDKSMKRDKIDIENNARKLETISGLYEEAVLNEDHEEALSLADHYAKTVDESATKLDNLVNSKSRRLAKDDVAIAPDEINSIQQYKQEKFTQAHNMVSSAVKKSKAAEATSAINMQEALESDTSVLKESLTKVERRNKANAPDVAKEARKVKDLIDSREYMSPDTFLDKVAKPEKLLALKADLENRLIEQKEDPNVGSSEQSVTQASLKLVEETLQEKRVFDEAKAERDRIDAARKLQQQNAQRLTSSDKPRVAARKKEQAGKANTSELEKRREAVRATQTKTVAKQADAKEVIKKQEKKLDKAPVTPVPAERKEELANSKARKIAIEKQKAQVTKSEKKTHGLPKKVKVDDLKKKEGEYVIVTPDNPMSNADTPAWQNRAARTKFTKWLDDQGIDYEVGDHSMFEGTQEKPFILKGVSKKQGKQISDMLKQSSFIHGKGDFADLVEGEKTNRINKRDIKVSPDATDYYTVVSGQKMTMPFFSEKSSNLDVAELQASREQKVVAKSMFRAAAVKLKGQVYEAASHMSAVMENKVLEDYINNSTLQELNHFYVQGFVTNDGKFMDRFEASQALGMKPNQSLISEDFLLKQKAEAMAKEGMVIENFDNLKLKDQMGTLEMVDALKNKMNTGKYGFLFDRAKKHGIETVFLTQPGDYRKNDTFKSVYPNMKEREDAANAFEGGLKVDPKTGQMVGSGGYKGVYLKGTGKAFINLPIISKSETSLGKAMETVVHENVHGIVDAAINDMTHGEIESFRKELDDLWESIPRMFLDGIRDGKNTHVRIAMGIIQIDKYRPELVTYALSHPEFAEFLDGIPASPKFKAKGKGIKSIWDALVDLILKKTMKMPSKYDELQDILNRNLQLADNTVKFSKEDVSFDFGANVTQENVQSWVDELDNAAVNSLGTTVVKDAEEAAKILGYNPGETAVSFWLPESQTTKPHGANKGWKPQTNPGRVVLIADRITSQEHAISKWMHEQVGHQGLHNIFPTKQSYDSFMEQAYRLFSIKDAAVLKEIEHLYDIGKLQNNGTRKLTYTERITAAEEVIGNRAGTLSPTSKKGLVGKLKAFLKRWLPKVFVGKKNEFRLNDKDVWSIIEMARENVFTGNNQFGELIKKSMDARVPKVKFQGWNTLPPFMKTDEEYKSWIREVRKADPKQIKWYTQHKDTLLKIFGKDADLFNILLSVTSPNADVETNVIFAAQTYAYLMGAVEKPGAMYVNKLQDRIDNNWTSPEAMYRNLESNLFKVTEFVRALMGDPDATVGDMWMYRAFFGDPLSHNVLGEKFSVPQTIAMRQKLHDLAAQMSDETGETYTPREIQAAIWVHINAKANNKSFGAIATYESGLNKPSNKFDGKTPLEWLQGLFPNMADGILGDKIGVQAIPMAEYSPLEKKLLGQINTELKSKNSKPGYIVDGEVITITPSENKRLETVRMMRAIADGGREVTVNDDVTATWLKKTFGFEETQKSTDNTVVMRLRDDAVDLYRNPKGKVAFHKIRDNLGGFSGTYTQEVKFSREARKNLDHIANLSQEKINEMDKDWLRNGNDESSVLFKVHEWRDQSELNMNRFTDQLEQDLLGRFGGKKSKVKGVGSGKLLNTTETELLQKAMNLYIDSGTGANRDKVMAYAKKVAGSKATNREKQHLEIINRMLNLSEEEITWADTNVRPYYAEMLEFAREHKIIDSEVENYVKRQWRMPKEFESDVVTWNGSGNTGFKLTSTSGKQRSFDSIVDGWERGMDLNTESIISNLQAYGLEVGHVFANRRFVNYLRDMIDFKTDGLMFEHSPKKSPDFKKPTGYSPITVRGFAKPGHVIYARNDIAQEVNKLGEGSGSAWNTNRWGLKFIKSVNSKIKSTVLSVSLFHHLAGLRSYMFAVQGSGWQRFRPFKAYKEGLRKLDERVELNYAGRNLGPIVDLLVREGLTVGKTQDWDETMIQNSVIEDMLSKGTSKASFVALKQWQKARRTRRSLTGGLFNRLFAGLKAESASIELIHRLKQIEKKQNGEAATDAQIKMAAQQTAAIINADFGGLHLGRLGRNPNTQKVLQMVMLAPDWTESNWRTVVGALPFAETVKKRLDKDKLTQAPEGMTKIYRKFWAGAAARGVMSVALGQAAILGLFGDEDDVDEYWDFVKTNFASWENFSKGRWISVDFTPLARKLGIGDPNKRQVFSVLGHFKDILKVADIRSLVKHKISPVGRVFETLWDGTDWKGSGFTTAKELIESGKLVRDSKFDGEAAGLTVWATLPSIIGYNIRSSFPIFGSELLQAATDEATWMSSIARAGGLDVRDVSGRSGAQIKFEDLASEVNELDRNLEDARTSKNQKMIMEARREISEYRGFNRVKSRIGFTKSRLAVENRKLRAINLKLREGDELTEAEQRKLEEVNKRKQAIYDKAVKVLDR